MYSLFLFSIFILFHEIGLGMKMTTADKLEFWTRYPENVGRRALDDSKHKKFTTQDSKVHFHLEKVKVPTAKRKFKIPKAHNVTLRARDEKETTDSQIRNRVHVQNRVQDVRSDSSRERKRTMQWPKVQKRFRTTNRKGNLRSTRIYLMQQDEDHETTTEKESSAELEALSPYSIKQDLEGLVDKFPEANITVEVIGRTIEYNDIVMLKVAERKSEIGKYFRADESKYIDEVPEKKIIFIVHGLNVMGLDEVHCLSKGKDVKLQLSYYFAHLDKFDIFVILMANPDGFSQPLWNKNMSPQGACSGVALDRNFDVAWNHSQVISSCSQHYPGPVPFSEPETKAIKEVFHRYSHKIHAYLDVHAGTYSPSNFKGDAVLYPKGFTDTQTDDDKYIDLRGEIDEAMKNASFQVLSVTVDTLHNWYGKISGSSVDYASSVYGVPYSLELVMQPYHDYHTAFSYKKYAQSEIWKRVIDVIFNNVWRNIKSNDVK